MTTPYKYYQLNTIELLIKQAFCLSHHI